MRSREMRLGAHANPDPIPNPKPTPNPNQVLAAATLSCASLTSCLKELIDVWFVDAFTQLLATYYPSASSLEGVSWHDADTLLRRYQVRVRGRGRGRARAMGRLGSPLGQSGRATAPLPGTSSRGTSCWY